MARIGKFRKGPDDRKRYVIDYADWLSENETISTVTMEGNIPADNFFIDGYVVNVSGGSKEVIFFVSGGLPGKEYNATVTINTSLTQTKEDFVTFVVTD